MTRTRGLGRGLGALIPATAGGIDEIDVDLIVPNPHQPRTTFNEESLDELVESIQEHGVLQPLLVSTSNAEGVYQLIAGERRLRAARRAGLSRVPVILKEAATRELLELALVENLQREDLNPIEEAIAYQRLGGEFGLTQDEIATRVSRSRAAVANTMRLLALSDEIKQSIAASAITEGHGRALLAITDETARRAAWQKVIDDALTVRQTEQLAYKSPARATATAKNGSQEGHADPETDQIEAKIRDALGTKVELRRQKNGHGRLVLHFFSDDELNGLLSRLGVVAE